MLLIITIIAVLLGLLIALVVFFKDSKSPINIWLSAFLVAVCLWVFSTNMLGAFWGGENVYPLRLPFVFALATGYAALQFAYHLCNRKAGFFVFWLETAAFIGCTILALSPFVIQQGYFSAETGTIVSLVRAPAYPLILAAIAYLLVKAILVIYISRRHALGNKKVQLGLVFFGLTFGTFLGVVTNVVLPNVTGTIQPARFAFISLLLLAASLSYAILRHSFMDIRLAIVRSVAYLLSILAIAAAYVVNAFGIATLFFPGIFSFEGQIFYMAIAVVVALTFDPMHKFFDKVTRSLFYRDAYDTQNVLDQLAGSLARETSVTAIAHNSLKLLYQALRSDYILLMLPKSPHLSRVFYGTGKPVEIDDHQWLKRAHFTNGLIVQDDILNERSAVLQKMKDNGVAVVVKIETSREVIGYALFGYKKNGSVYTQQDSDLIRLAADELAVAMQNAMRFEEIESFNITLREEVKEATAQLRDSNRKLRKLDEAKDEFISMASHQLRTPLTSVKGYISMALEGDAGKLNPSQQKLLEEAFMSAQRMVYLIGDFLNVSRLQTGKFVLEPRHVNVAVLVQEEIDQLVTVARRRNITLEYHRPEHFPALSIDEDKMRQVIMNFIDNAIYYSKPDSKVRIELIATARDVQLRVRDTGIGVPDAERHHLFTKFYRAENARRVRPDGTGVGLFMAKKVITAHGGSIIFESQLGKGSTFGFSLPLKLSQPSEDQPEQLEHQVANEQKPAAN